MFRSAKDIHEDSPWEDLTPGAEIYEPATSRYVNTGEWRVMTPVFIEDKCKQCLMCTPYCPDASIPVVEGKRTDFDYDHCKGCGICINACPFDAIVWKEEA